MDVMTPGLREHKQASLRVAVAECLPEDMRDQTREIVSLACTNPRKGYATTLMWTVCFEADEGCITLILQPRSFGNDGMDDAKLERYYSRFGFVVIQRQPVVLMARSPQGRRLVTLQ